ncbi:MAG TPA: DUF2066 domain-containing protein [Fontimonas sp.]
MRTTKVALVPLLGSILALLGAALAGSPAQAQLAGTAQAYEARIPVADESDAARGPALRLALSEVVARVSGPAAPMQASSLLDQASALVQRFGYQKEVDNSLVLVAAFDGTAVERRLKAMGLPVWGVYAASVEEVQMQVSGIRSGADYLQLMTTLQGLPNVRGVDAVRAAGDLVELRVRAEGGAGRLSGALMSNGRLVRDTAAGAELAYRLIGGAP